MDFFWKNYDPKGYSIWYIKYNKVQGEGKILFQTNNLMNGFLQRLDTFRKYAFGIIGVYGDEPHLDIKGIWAWRGVDKPAEILEHPSYEYYEWKKLDETNEADRKLLEEYWIKLDEG